MAMFAIPVLIGTASFIGLHTLRNEELATRDERLWLWKVREAANVQHQLLDHAREMGTGSADLRTRIMEARRDGTEAIRRLLSVTADQSYVERLSTRWEVLQEGASREVQMIDLAAARSDGEDDSMMKGAAIGTPSEMEDRSEMDGPTITSQEASDSPDPGSEDMAADPRMGGADGDHPSPAGERLDRLTISLEATDRDLVQQIARMGFLTDVGTVGILLLEALAVAILIGRFSRMRRESELAGARTDALLQSEARFRSLVQNSTDVVSVLNGKLQITYESAALKTVLGYERDRVGHGFLPFVHPDDSLRARSTISEVLKHKRGYERAEIRVIHADETWRWMDVQMLNLSDDTVGGIVLNQRDISEKKTMEKELRRRSLHDALTGLPNRTLLSDRLKHALRSANRTKGSVAVLFLDLDNFKGVNDTLGHAFGDDLLRAVAGRISDCLRDSDTPARLGGDEFAILLEHFGTREDAEVLGTRILETLRAPFSVNGRQITISASLGLSLATGSETDADELLKNADFAMYVAKEGGKDRFAFFDEELYDTASERYELEGDLRRALVNDELILHFQPITDMASLEVKGAEALVRWVHPVKGIIPPLEFIPVAEQSGFIVDLGRWVLRKACEYAAEWRKGSSAEAFDFTINVNVSPEELRVADYVAKVQEILASTGLEPEALVLEVTESAVADRTVIDHLRALKKMGVKIAIDDFGVGYSSLSRLRALPVDIIKIDRSFILDMANDEEARALVSVIIALARTFGLRSHAEGIEHADHLEALRQLGCDLAQGYFLAKPMEAENLRFLCEKQFILEGVSGESR